MNIAFVDMDVYMSGMSGIEAARKLREKDSERKTVTVFLADIMSVVSSGHYLQISMTDGTHLKTRMTTGALLSLLDYDSHFLCVNKVS